MSKSFSVTIPDDLYNRFERRRIQIGETRSAAIKSFIESYLEAADVADSIDHPKRKGTEAGTPMVIQITLTEPLFEAITKRAALARLTPERLCFLDLQYANLRFLQRAFRHLDGTLDDDPDA